MDKKLRTRNRKNRYNPSLKDISNNIWNNKFRQEQKEKETENIEELDIKVEQLRKKREKIKLETIWNERFPGIKAQIEIEEEDREMEKKLKGETEHEYK